VLPEISREASLRMKLAFPIRDTICKTVSGKVQVGVTGSTAKLISGLRPPHQTKRPGTLSILLVAYIRSISRTNNVPLYTVVVLPLLWDSTWGLHVLVFIKGIDKSRPRLDKSRPRYLVME
jgi:hypothetical protein